MAEKDFEMFRCFKDGMVLQRESDVKIWGFAKKGTVITLEFDSHTYEAEADESGEFVFDIKTGNAGGPYFMKVSSENYSEEINDIFLGDVYIASGQSNMELHIERTIDLIGNRIEDINYPMIREFRVPEQIRFGGYDRQFNGGDWLKASDKNDILNMSAAAFHFAEQIFLSEGIPVGIINNSIGGTPIEAHLPEEVLAKYKIYDDEIEKCRDDKYVKKVQEEDAACMDRWYKELDEKDKGIIDGKPVYAECDYDDSGWESYMVPDTFHHTALKDFHGSLWFRKEFDIPKDFLIDDVMLRLGAVIDADRVYLNGEPVGATEYMYPPRRYPLKPGILKHGKNILAVRLIINRGTGGFVKGKKYCLQGKNYIYEGSYAGTAGMPEDADVSNGRWEFDLSGEWKYAVGAEMEVLPLMTFFQYKPSGLYNSMMKPLERYTFKGGLWYQGESNAGAPEQYASLMKDLITCWRKWFGENLPFFYVQLPQFDDPSQEQMQDKWYEFREIQRQTLEINNTAMAVAIDIGESNDLHPQNKETLGKRLALAALNMIYGKDIEYSGPVAECAYGDSKKNTVTIEFSHCAGGIKLVNDNYGYFEVCSKGAEWIKVAGYRAEDNKIILECPKDDIQYSRVRYAWFNDPCKPPVYNAAGLPASPFINGIL